MLTLQSSLKTVPESNIFTGEAFWDYITIASLMWRAHFLGLLLCKKRMFADDFGDDVMRLNRALVSKQLFRPPMESGCVYKLGGVHFCSEEEPYHVGVYIRAPGFLETLE